jgi:putative nucleotidyltransferase with HDIG domain
MVDPEPDPNERSFYAGRWIASIRGHIIGQGGTPEQALRAAQASRFKETPQVLFVPTTSPIIDHPILTKIPSILPQDLPVYVVGGAVRDSFLNRSIHELDFALPSDAIKTAREVADALGGAFYILDQERDYGRVILRQTGSANMVMDFAAFQGPNLESDLKGRDFRINAMAVDVRRPDELLDPLGGSSDLSSKKLRACTPGAFIADPIRILRGVRFAILFNLKIQPDTLAQMRAAVHLLPNISAERLRDELFQLLDCPSPATAIRALNKLGAIPYTLPELADLKNLLQPPPHIHDAWEHSLNVSNQLNKIFSALQPKYDPDSSANLSFGLISIRLGRYREQLNAHWNEFLNIDRPLKPLLILGALYHDIGKPQTRQIDNKGKIRFHKHEKNGAELVAARGHALQLSNPEIERLSLIVLHHMRPIWLTQTAKLPTRRAIFRFFRATGAAGIDVCMLSLADTLATFGPTLPTDMWAHQVEVVRSLLEAWWERKEETIYPQALVNGNDLMSELGITPGPIIGRILDKILEAQACGEIINRRQALELASELLNESGDSVEIH